MDLEQELNKLNIQIRFSLKNNYNNEYYIIIKNSNIETKYIAITKDIESTCSYIATSIIKEFFNYALRTKLNLIESIDIINSIIRKPKLNKIKKTYKIPKYSYFPKNHKGLKDLVNKLIKIRGNVCSFNDIDVSEIKDMNCIFLSSSFNGDISKWNVSNVIDMFSMFEYSKFNRDISKWNVSKVKYMNSIFKGSPLEKNPPTWYNTSSYWIKEF